jgi:hypothetical protein
MRERNKLLSLIIFFSLSIGLGAQADSGTNLRTLQLPLPDQPAAPYYTSAGLMYDWESNSTAFNNASLLSLIRSNKITNEAKNSNDKNLRGKNYYVDHSEGLVYYVLPVKKRKDLGILFELGIVSQIDASFTKDAYDLVMYGNAHYKNETKNFGNMLVRNIAYQRLGIGIDKYSSDYSHHFRVSLNLIKGDYFNEFRISRGSVYTEENGEYLDIDLKYERHFASLEHLAFGARGYGAGLYGEWNKLMIKQQSRISFQVRDLGFISYPGSTPHHSIDTAIHFTGVSFGSFKSYSSSADINVSDSMEHYFNMKKNNERYNFMLPLSLRLKYEKFGRHYDVIKVQFNWFLYNASPQVILGYAYPVKKALMLGGDLRLGGYGTFDFDVNLKYSYKKILLEAAVKSLEGLVLVKSASGLGAFVHLGYYLN